MMLRLRGVSFQVMLNKGVEVEDLLLFGFWLYKDTSFPSSNRNIIHCSKKFKERFFSKLSIGSVKPLGYCSGQFSSLSREL